MAPGDVHPYTFADPPAQVDLDPAIKIDLTAIDDTVEREAELIGKIADLRDALFEHYGSVHPEVLPDWLVGYWAGMFAAPEEVLGAAIEHFERTPNICHHDREAIGDYARSLVEDATRAEDGCWDMVMHSNYKGSVPISAEALREIARLLAISAGGTDE